MSVAVHGQEFAHLRGLVGREIVGDDVNLFALGLVGHDVGEKGDELGRGVTSSRLAQHLAGQRAKGCIQRQRAATEGLKAVTLDAPWRQRQHGGQAIQRLDGRLLIDAKHRRVLRRVQVQPNHIGRLGFKVRIVGGEIAFEQMGLDAVLGPDSHHRHVRDVAAQPCGQFARGPVCGAVSGLVSGGAREPRFQTIGHLVALTPRMTSKQARQAIAFEAFAPAINKAVATVQLGANLGPREAIGQQQDHARVARRIGPAVLRCRLLLTFHAFAFGECHRLLRSRCNDTSFLNVTVR